MAKFTRRILFVILLFFTTACCQNSPDINPQSKNTIEQIQADEVIFIDTRGRQLLVNYDTLNQTATLQWESITVTLNQVRSASGIKYSHGNLVFWSKGNSALYVKNGTTLFKGLKQP